MGKIQFESEEEFNRFFNNLFDSNSDQQIRYGNGRNIRHDWAMLAKEKGYIKQSDLEKADIEFERIVGLENVSKPTYIFITELKKEIKKLKGDCE
ncbi:MAG: hypothetical protein GY870_22445 [archaeon]|nr:hypothetical protein [archaeon]